MDRLGQTSCFCTLHFLIIRLLISIMQFVLRILLFDFVISVMYLRTVYWFIVLSMHGCLPNLYAPLPRPTNGALSHIQWGRRALEPKHSTGTVTAEAKGGGPGLGLPSGGSAQDGATAKGGQPVLINGSNANASSVDAGDGSGVKASARNVVGSTHQLGSGSAALGNGTVVPFINQTMSAGAAAMDGHGTASHSSGTTGNNQTLLIQSPVDSKIQTRSSAASNGSSNSENKQIESTVSILISDKISWVAWLMRLLVKSNPGSYPSHTRVLFL
jgi:hypothetical protein